MKKLRELIRSKKPPQEQTIADTDNTQDNIGTIFDNIIIKSQELTYSVKEMVTIAIQLIETLKPHEPHACIVQATSKMNELEEIVLLLLKELPYDENDVETPILLRRLNELCSAVDCFTKLITENNSEDMMFSASSNLYLLAPQNIPRGKTTLDMYRKRYFEAINSFLDVLEIFRSNIKNISDLRELHLPESYKKLGKKVLKPAMEKQQEDEAVLSSQSTLRQSTTKTSRNSVSLQRSLSNLSTSEAGKSTDVNLEDPSEKYLPKTTVLFRVEYEPKMKRKISKMVSVVDAVILNKRNSNNMTKWRSVLMMVNQQKRELMFKLGTNWGNGKEFEDLPIIFEKDKRKMTASLKNAVIEKAKNTNNISNQGILEIRLASGMNIFVEILDSGEEKNWTNLLKSCC